jgi:uncharacterized membrane protein YebE (DUF533 family)
MKINLTNVGIIAGGLALAYYLYKNNKKQTGYIQASQYIPAWGGADVSLSADQRGGLTWL